MGKSRRNKPGAETPRTEPAAAEAPAEPAVHERDLPVPARPAPPVAPPLPRPPTGAGRAYTVAFGRVWRAAQGVIEQNQQWTVVSSDPVRGEILVQIRGLIRRTPRSARIALWLDEVGLTRVEAAVLDSGGTAPIARFYRRLERALAAGG